MKNIKVILGDITTAKTDLIVNAANAGLNPGGGVCGAVYKAVGPELNDLIKSKKKLGFPFYKGDIPTNTEKEKFGVGCAMITSNWVIDVEKEPWSTIWNIIHAVGPIYEMHSPENAAILLERTYISIIAMGDLYSKTSRDGSPVSIAVPLISTGIYGYPLVEGINIAIETLARANDNLHFEIWCFTEGDFEITTHLLDAQSK